MRSCQGPALWVYNDAIFKDEDFINITRLNEATKVHDTEKIGRFGLGFNAVYNLTDVPMFVSRNYFVIFDPHTTYLGNVIANTRKPGIKIDLNKDVKRLHSFKNQFKPFNGVFGCDLHLEKEHNSFDGTLFRFPLRTREQAARSEIKKLFYSDQEMRQLLQMFLDRAMSLLLFTQNVFHLEVYRTSESFVARLPPELMFQVSKSMLQGGIMRELTVPVILPATAMKLDAENQTLLRQCNFLQASSMAAKKARSHAVEPSEFPESSIAIEVHCSVTESGLKFFKRHQRFHEECETWLIVSSMGNGQALQFSKNDPSLLPSASVAVQWERNESGNFIPVPIVKDVEGSYHNGTIFCYLPLPIHSGLSIHINGPFAVTSNRRHLQKKLEDDKTCYGVKWNSVLLQDSVVSAFLKLLEDVKQIIPGDGSYVYHSLWPRACSVCQDCWSFLASFYEQITSRGHHLFSDGLRWGDISQVVFLDPSLRMNPEIGSVSFSVLQQLTDVNYVVIDLPPEVFQSILDCDLGHKIKGKTFNETRFFRDLLFPNISKISADVRDSLVLYALNRNSKDFNELIKNYACIPVSPKGNELKSPRQLVNPYKEASRLFCRDDGMFPFGNESTFLNPQVLTKLEILGMKSSDLPWQDIVERAESVQRLNTSNSKAAVKRAKELLDFLEKKLKRKGEAPPPHHLLTRLLQIQFLPVLQKPEYFPLPWKGEEFRRGRGLLVAPENVYLKEKMYLVCCTEPLVSVDVPKRVRNLLRLNDKDVTAGQVLKQLEWAVSAKLDALDRNGFEQVARICTEAYLYLQDNMDSLVNAAKQFLLKRKFILMEKDKLFAPAARVAFEITTDCSPYLFKLPKDFCDRFPNLMIYSGVKKQFDEADYVSSLVAVKQQFDQKQLDETTLQVAVNMGNQLANLLCRDCVDACEVQNKLGCVYLPDSKKVMRDVAELCFKECPWMPDDPDEVFVHEKIPWSTCEQLAVKTRRDEALQQHDIGFPFGQKEKLTNRLKRILTGYQGEKEILKELLQNADDAQATEIYFIKDPRHHPDKRVFKDSWKPLQGPALCVYNNKPFTNADIAGICNLGEGSKGDDPNKTGQYGVGFNAVYQLTDVPSFISKSEEIGDVLCVFDPHCKYIPHSSESRPGRMFKDINMLRQKFPDVFPCYLEEHFPVQNATMFRFPLKSEEMARESQICRTSVTVEKLDEMMEDLKKELFEVLLFVNNVKKISIAAVDVNGQLINDYSVQVVMSEDDARKREEFSCYIKEIGRQVREKRILPINVKVKRRTYTLQLKDNRGMSEQWLIVQQVGLEKPVKQSVSYAFQGDQLGMLPRGGVACLLDSTSQSQREKRAYCFLPLPLRTNLPVHINGHFALDHETRRNLWRCEVGGYQSDWNSALLSDVIASCYLTLLDKVRDFIQLPVGQDSKCSSLACSKPMILRRIRSYERLFPSYPINDPFWKTLADAVYQEMNKKKLRLIPLVRSEQGGFRGRSKDLQQTECVELSWFPTTGTGSDQTYFNNLEIKGYFAPLPPRRDEKEEDTKRREESRIKRKAAFEEILLETGFNLVSFSLNVFHSLKEAAVEVYCVSPAVVMDFYKSFSDDDPVCRIGAVPCHVTKTPFKDTEGVVRVLKYCKDDEHFLESLPGLPLLLTQDNCLHSFSETQPRCLSRYEDILPRSGPLFVHNRVRLEVFSSVDPRNVSVFCPLDVKTFASQLHLTLPSGYHSEDRYVKWYPENKSGSLPNLRWIYRVWDFLQDFARTATMDKDVKEETMAAFIRDLFSPLWKWSLLPSTETSSLCNKQQGVTHFLVPLKKAEAVLDFKDCGTTGQKLVAALRNLGLPELNTTALTTQSIGSVSYSNRDSYEIARNLVATVSSPHSLLFALNQKLQWDSSSLDNKLELTDAIVVLDYFSRNIGSLTDADREILRKLPFYPSANDVLQNLQGKEAYVIPYEIPATEMRVVESKLGCLLLRSRLQLSDLFEFLHLESASHCEVYMNFVLRCFQMLNHDARLTHLRFIRDFISLSVGSENQQEKIEKTRLFEHLKEVELIPSTDGTLKTVSSYYDPCNDVFVAMLPQESFPPEAFKSEEWLTFLRKIGLVQDVSHQNFLKFAKQVEREAETARTDDINQKSEVLVYHLISRPNVVGEGLLPIIRDIAFVAADPVDERLQIICPPIGGRNKGKVPFIAFSGAVVNDHEKIAWTEAHMLPRWADPRFQTHYLDCPHRHFDQYLNSLLSQLDIMTKPSVDLVVRHCQTICYHLGVKESGRENLSSENLSTIVEVMGSIYSFLQKNAMNDTEAKRKLQKTPCILVEKGTKLIFPRQAILELYEHLEIKPFLYRVPPEFGMFHPLFEFLGCSKSATPIHYAMVFEMLQKNSQGETLHPNEVRICSKAVEGFVYSLQRSADVSTLSTLYLPAMPSRDRVQNSASNKIPVSLQESKELLFDDAPTYSDRIKGLDQPFVLDLSLLNEKFKFAEVNYKDVLLKLPNPLQPIMLSLVVKEKLADPENTVTVTTGVVNVLKQQLSSVHFGHGIVRIIRDANSRKGDASKGVSGDILEGLQTIKLFAVENLSTTLLHNGVLIPGSERKVPYFKEKLEVSESHIWKVYVDAANRTDDKTSLSTLLAKVIVDIYGQHLGQNVFVIPEMLQCSPTMIQSLLDRHGIQKDDSSNAVEMTVYPEPGTLIPIEDHHLLDDAFEEFEPGDYVGFQLHDPSLGTTGQKLVAALRNLGLPELNTTALTTQSIGSVSYSNRDSYEIARNLVATVSSPHSLLFALNQKLQWDSSSLDNKLELTDAIVVLDYFSRNIGSLTDADREILRKLPFYPSANDVLQNLQGKEAYVIPYEIPATEMRVVESKLGCLLLRSRLQLSDLFEFLHLESASHCEVYMNFVLRCFQMLNHDARLTHLRFIRDFISLSVGSENQQEKIEKTRLFEHLKEVELIPSTDGTLKTVSSYYDPCNDVFVAMLPQESFPPEAFKSEEWLTFLRKIGLVQDVSHQNFLKFAKQVEREAETARTDDINQKSEVLVYHLISRPNVVGEGLLPIIRDIAFVAADPVDERLQIICPPIGGRNKGKVPFIAFSGAVVNDHEKIAWTEAHMLPRWADPRFQTHYLDCPHRHFDQYLNSLLSQLDIMTKPSVDLVVRHCQTICYHLGVKESGRENLSSENLSTIVEVMGSIYSFLQKNAMNDTEAKRKLQKTPCILVEKGTKLIFPRQAILELYEHLEIKPFLYRVPPEFGMFHPLFEFLGCSKSATPIHYAMVFEMLQKNSQGETLHPNEVRICSKAVEGFVYSLQRSADVSTLSTLYLPAMPSRDRVQNSASNKIPVSLQESKELLFDDAPTYSDRIKGLDQPFVLDLSLLNEKFKFAEVNYKDVLLKLPNPLQPIMLSLVVKEKLADPENTVTVTTGVVNVLKQQLSSVHFGHGIVRIIRDANSRKGDASKGVSGDILEGLQTIKLFAVENLSTTLLHNGVLIPGSERKVPYFKEKLEVSESHIWKVYVDAANRTDDKTSLSTLLAKVIVDIYGQHLGQNVFVIPEMLQCSPTMIQSLLDRHGIQKDDSSNAVEMTVYPEPGTLIPIEDHHLLDDAFEEFEPGDYVGFQLHDPSLDLMDGTATYIYAIIIEEVTDEDANLLTKTYRIDIGNDKEPVEVKATKLFKFCRLKAIFDELSGCHRSRQEVFDEISSLLKQAWEPHVSEEERRQIIKRLCLRWHPKKNAGNEEFYRSVYQHLSSEVARLGGSYDEFFYSWGERAREHGSQREEYRRNFSRRYGAWESSSSQRSWHDLPPTFCIRNPQPGEAKRWFRQAKADLQAGSEELCFSTSSCEWICFKFHQVNSTFINSYINYIQLKYVPTHTKYRQINTNTKNGRRSVLLFYFSLIVTESVTK